VATSFDRPSWTAKSSPAVKICFRPAFTTRPEAWNSSPTAGARQLIATTWHDTPAHATWSSHRHDDLLGAIRLDVVEGTGCCNRNVLSPTSTVGVGTSFHQTVLIR
jgi:hypothetical protein